MNQNLSRQAPGISYRQQRLLPPIGYIPPSKAEAQYYRQSASKEIARLT